MIANGSPDAGRRILVRTGPNHPGMIAAVDRVYYRAGIRYADVVDDGGGTFTIPADAPADGLPRFAELGHAGRPVDPFTVAVRIDTAGAPTPAPTEEPNPCT